MNTPNITIADCVKQHLDKFFSDLEDQPSNAIYDMVISAVEKPMLEVVMDKAGYNQTIASQMLGINRNTLRKKLQQYQLI
jgi:Fis family transcriptional regulator, factor for inversion stimulation protein